jgi:hypothetical protein
LVYSPINCPALSSYLLTEDGASGAIKTHQSPDIVAIDLREIPAHLSPEDNGYRPLLGADGAKEERYMLCERGDEGTWAVDTLPDVFPHTKNLVFAEVYAQLHENDNIIVLDAGQILRFFLRDKKGRFIKRPYRHD